MYNLVMRLNYDDLVRDYLESLHSKLRNFSVEAEFLETWVHDENDVTSLYELFAAAREAGCRELAVVVEAKTAGRVDRSALEKRLVSLGTVQISDLDGGAWEVVAVLSTATAPASAPAAVASRLAQKERAPARKPIISAPTAKRVEGIHPAYCAAIAALSAHPRHEGPAPDLPAGSLLIETSDRGANLAITVSADGSVVAAHHSGATGELRGLLDGLCDLLPGRPFQEGNDHAMIRLEAKLRDYSVPAPVTGLLTPRNADPVFERPLAMLRAAYRLWLVKSGAKPGWNFWDYEPAADWLALPPAERLARAKTAIADGCRTLKVPPQGIEVLELLNGCRIVLAAAPETIKPSFALQMIKLEGLAKKALDPRIELQLESLEDRNRRAARTDRNNKLV